MLASLASFMIAVSNPAALKAVHAPAAHARSLAAHADVEWTPVVEPDGNLFPSFFVSTATVKWPEEPADAAASSDTVILGDPHGMIGIGIVAPDDNVKIRVRIEAPEVMETSTFTGVLSTKGTLYAVAPVIKWKYKALLESRQQMPLNVTFKVKVGDEDEQEKLKVVTLRSVNDCLHTFLAGEDVRLVRWLFAAYVNEDHPWVDGLLKEALETGLVARFTGYQENDPEVVLKQVYAVWNVLQRRGMRYSNIVQTSAVSEKVGSQHVRMLDEAVEMKQANCVDGSVLFASVLRKIGLEVNLVLVPGHMFLAFKTDPNADELVGFETTVIGQHTKADFDKTAKLRELMIDAPSFDDVSWETFEAALKVGTDRLALDKDKFADETEIDFQLISVAEARRMGVRPMPYLKAVAPAAPKIELDTLRLKK